MADDLVIHSIVRTLLGLTSSQQPAETNALLRELAERVAESGMSLDTAGNLTFPESMGIGRADSADVQLHVKREQGTTGDKTVQIDMNVESGTGGVWIGAVVNARTSTASTWTGTGGQIFALATEANTRRPGTAEVFGLNAQAKLLSGATGGNEITCAEFDVISEEEPALRVGVAVSAVPSSELPTTENVPASGIDAAYVVIAKDYGARFKDGLLFFNVSGTRWPINETTGTLIRCQVDGAHSILNGIDLSDSDLTISGHAWLSPNFRVTGAGVLQLADGITAPGTVAGWAQIYVDTADGDLKVKFGDGTIKTIVVDT